MVADFVKLDVGIEVYLRHLFELIPVSVFLSFEITRTVKWNLQMLVKLSLNVCAPHKESKPIAST